MKQFLKSDICLKCQGCCRFSAEDSAWVPNLLAEEAGYCGQGNKIKVVPSEKGFLCSFLEGSSNKCRIYPGRPLECQLYPFLINRQGNEIFLAVDLNCPFAQEHFNQPEFKEYSEYLRDFLNSPEQLRVFKKNPQMLESYQGINNLLLLEIRP